MRLHSAGMYQLKSTLLETTPAIWRRLLVPSDLTLHQVHKALQIAMGWTNCHPHMFVIEGRRYSDLKLELDEITDEKSVRLKAVVSNNQTRLMYQYDFGDNWNHLIELEEICSSDKISQQCLCLGGERKCPPDDCGGANRYEEILAILQDPLDPEHDEIAAWVGRKFDPKLFDLGKVNRRLKRI